MRLTRRLDEAMIQIPRQQRLRHFSEPELEDSRNIIDIAEILFREQVDSFQIYR